MVNNIDNVYTPDKQQAIWNCARACALNQKLHKCSYTFGDAGCSACDLYICNYGNFSPQDAKLYMLQARGSAREIHQAGKMWMLLFVPVILIAMAWGCSQYTAEQTLKRFAKEDAQQKSQIWHNPKWDYIDSPKDIVPNSKEVWGVLQQVSYQMDGGVDVDHDGLSNCVDAAVVFYAYYHLLNGNVKIMENHNPNGKMFHLFNAVYIAGEWIYIEPQAVWKHQASYLMHDVWGDVYNPAYNVDKTDVYKKYGE